MKDTENLDTHVLQEKSKALQTAEGYFGVKYPELLKLGGKTKGDLPPKTVHQLMGGIENLAQANFSGITSAQIRKVFGIFKELEAANPLEMVKLKYKLDYLLARQKNDQKAAVIIALIKDMLDQIANLEDLNAQAIAVESFYTVMEAIVAYHKYYEELSK
jgi:CRISPR type III-A-associated protein Csm2